MFHQLLYRFTSIRWHGSETVSIENNIKPPASYLLLFTFSRRSLSHSVRSQTRISPSPRLFQAK